MNASHRLLLRAAALCVFGRVTVSSGQQAVPSFAPDVCVPVPPAPLSWQTIIDFFRGMTRALT